MVASADLLSPLVAIGRGNEKPLKADTVVAKSGGDLDGKLPLATQQTPGITGEEQTCLHQSVAPQNRTASIALHSQNNSAIVKESH